MKKGWLDKYSETAQVGETISGPTVYSRNDPAYKAYQDSLNLYKAGTELLKLGRDNPFFINADYDRINNKYVSDNPANNIGSNKGPHIDAVDYQMIGDVNNPYRQGIPLYKKPTNPSTIAKISKLKLKGITSAEKKLTPRETPQFSKPIDKSLVRTEKQWLNKNTYNGEPEGDYLLNFYNDGSVEKTPYKKMQTGGKKEKISTSIPYEEYNQKNITPKQALAQGALQYIFGNPSENYNPQPTEQVPNDATNRQPYISKQQAEQISKDVRNPYYGSPNYHVPIKETQLSPSKKENKMDNELVEKIKKEEEKQKAWDKIHYGSKTAINLANMLTAGTMPPLAYSAAGMDAWDAISDYNKGDLTGAMNNATGALLNILPQTLGLNTRSFTPSTNSYATARWWKNNPNALTAPTTITPNLIDYTNRGLGLSTQYVNPVLNAFVNNKLNIRGVQTPITGKLASDIGLSVDDAYKTIHKNGGEVNYNNSNVSLPEGFVGMGNDISGRNYSPSWGGSFQNGGWASKYISEDKFLQPNSEKLPTGYKIPNRYPSSELAMSVGGEDGEPAYLIPSFKYGQPLEDPLKEYRETGDYLGGPFKTWQEADDWDINVRHPYVEKNQAIPFPIRTKGKDMQMGGILPSAFVRTGNIPSEGKYAKKTMPSAQDGLISHPGGNRNIHTNQVTITPRQQYENIQAEKRKQSELYGTSIPYEGSNPWQSTIPVSKPKGATLEDRKKIAAYAKKNEEAYNKKMSENANDYESPILEQIQKANQYQRESSDVYTDPQTGEQKIQNIGIQPSASPIDAAVLGVGALYSGGIGLLGSMAELANPLPINPFKVGNYQKGLAKIMPEKEYIKLGHTSKELKELGLAFSPSTTKALGRLDDNIAKEMLFDYKFGEYPSVKDFRIAVKKAILESERLKKINPAIDFGKIEDVQWALKDPKNLQNYADIQTMLDKTTNSQQKLMRYLDKGYNEKMNLINQHDVFKNIANESPQYTDIIHAHLKNPKVTDDEFLNNLVKQSNTFTRGVSKPVTAEELLTIKGRSLLEGNKNTMDVEGFPVSGNYGDYRYKIEPNAERMTEISSLPMEQRWSQRFPETFSGNSNDIKLTEGWHGKQNQQYADWYRTRMDRNRATNNVPIIKFKVPENAPVKYYHYPQHSIFSSGAEDQMLKGFDVSKMDISKEDTWKYIPGFTKGLKDGGVVKDNNGYWNPDNWGHPVRINSNDITMQGVDQPLWGISDTGDTKYMEPGQDYRFKGTSVTEYPMAQDGKELQKLDQLTNFTNYGKGIKGGWLEKYSK